MPKTLSSQQVADYERDGFVFPVPVLSAAEIYALRDQSGLSRQQFYLQHWARLQPGGDESAEEQHANPRSASAKLRFATRQ